MPSQKSPGWKCAGPITGNTAFTQFLAVQPTNLYGINDNYDAQNSHVLQAFIRKCHEAKTSGAKQVTIWGTGSPRREFIYADDFGRCLPVCCSFR